MKTLESASEQEVFDQVAKHMLTQNKKSVDVKGRGYMIGDVCRYRGEADLKCAAGCLMADEEYKESFEYKSWDDLVVKKIVSGIHKGLIMKLQYIHDNKDPSEWLSALEGLRAKYGLKFNKN